MKNLRSLNLISIIFVLHFLNAGTASASHIIGGNLGYEYLGETTPGSGIYRYKVILQTYINCDPNSFVAFCEDPVEIAVYSHDASNPNANKTLITTLNISNMKSDTITPDLPDSCTVGKDACILGCVYEGTVDLPLSFNGYNLMYHRCCRNCAILNIDQPSCPGGGDVGLTWYAFIPATLTDNSSPVFTDSPVPYICADDTTSILNTASDPDGDKLIFSFVTPYHGDGGGYPNPYIWPIPDVPYKTGFDKDKPFGSGGYSYINASSGYSEYYPPDTGNFVVAVEIKEYRNNVLIGISRRDLQLLVIQCPPNPPPNLTGAQGQGEIDYTIEEGDDLCFPISFWDTGGDSLEMILTGEVFDINKVNPVATANQNVKGDSLVKTDFCWNTVCNQERALKYTFYAKVSDNGCPSKTTNVEYRIKVDEFKGAESITGKSTVCALDKGVSYSVASFTNAKYGWTITGGTKVSGDSTNSITVDWGASGTGNVKLTTFSKNKCTGTTVNLSVKIDTLPVAKAGTDVSFCSKDTVSLGSTPIATYSYTWSTTSGLVGGNIGNPKLTLTNTGAIPDTNLYILTVVDTIKSCTSKDTVQSIVRPYPIPNAGADQSFCSGSTVALGTNSTVNYTYLWKPKTGLSDTTSSKPNLTLTNSDSIPDTFSYKVITTVYSCTASDSARIIVKPLPVSDAGSDLTFCSEKNDTLGAKSKNGYSYSWSPTKGLSSTIVSNPVISLTNTGNKPETVTYTVTTTLNACVTKDSAKVTTLPLPVSFAGTDKRICPDETDTLGKDTVTRYKFSWNPSFGLNNTTLRNPLVKINVPDTSVTYVVTTTDTTTGCVSTDTVKVVIKPLPVSNAGPDTTLCSGDTISVGANSTTNYSYLWNPLTGILDSIASRPLLTLTNSSASPDTSFYIVKTTLEKCITYDTVRVEIKNLPVSDAGSDVSFCTGDTISMGIASKPGYTYAWKPGNGLSDSTISNPEITLTKNAFPPDTVNYYLTNTLRLCKTSDTARVVVFPNPNTKEVIGSVSLCPGVTDVNYWVERPPNSTYEWFLQGGGSITSGQGNDTIFTDWPTPGPGKISVVETDSNTCVGDTFSIDLKVHYELEPPVPKGPDTLCDRYIDSVKYYNIYTNGSTYTWFIEDGLLLTIDSNRVYTKWNGVGSGKLWYEEVSITDTVCKGISDTLFSVIYKSPVADSITGQFEICEDSASIQFYINGLPGSNFTWLVDEDTAANGVDVDTVYITWDTAGIYQLKVIETTPNACSETLIDTMIVYKTPRTSSIKGDTVICFVNGDQFPYEVEGLDSSVFVWNITGGSMMSVNDLADSVSVRWDSVGVHKIIVTEVSKDSCIGASVLLNITLNETPSANAIEGNFYMCEKNTNIQYRLSGLDSSTYYWSATGAANIQDDSSNTIILDWDSAAYYQVSVLEISNKGCVGDTVDSLVQVNPLPQTSAITGDTTICFFPADSFPYSVNGFTNSYFHWEIIGGKILGADSVDTVIVRWDSVGSAQIKVVEESIDTCWGDIMKLNIVLWKVPDADSIIGNSYMCEKNTGITYQINGLDSSTFFWKSTGGTNIIDDSSKTFTIDWDTAGNYELSVFEVSIKGCKDDTVKRKIKINPLPQTSLVSGDSIICPSFEILYPYTVIGLDSSRFIWTLVDGNIMAGDSSDSIMVKWDSISQSTNISAFEISKDTCTNYSVSKEILLDAPHLKMINTTTEEKDHQIIDLKWLYIDKNQFPENIMIFKRKRFENEVWELAYTLPSTEEAYSDKEVLTEKSSYEYKVYGLNACGDTLKTVFHNTILLNGEMDESKESVSLNWNRYNTWETGVDHYQLWRKLDDEDKFQFYKNLNLDTLIYLENGDDAFVHCFRIIAIASSGVESWSNEFCVEFQHLLNPPNAISPNGDEFNEYWTIDDIQRYPSAKVVIFNRWGNEVYRSIGYNNDFNGERNGEPLPDGTYFYIIEPNRGSEVYNGYLTIVR